MPNMKKNGDADVATIELEPIAEEANAASVASVENGNTDDTSNEATESPGNEKPLLLSRRKAKMNRVYRRSRSRGCSPARVTYRSIRNKSPSRCMRNMAAVVQTALTADDAAANSTQPHSCPNNRINSGTNSTRHTNLEETSVVDNATNENGDGDDAKERNEREDQTKCTCHCNENVESTKTSKKRRVTETLFGVASGVCRFVRYPLMVSTNAATLYLVMNSLGFNGLEYASRAVSMLQPLVGPLLSSNHVVQAVTSVGQNVGGSIPAALASSQYLGSGTFK
ncbi:hypothetical protein KP791_000080 [Venturia canescens]|uniref:Uncharacterized protein n=1 Tax=Venturia canescens TaxID=32260 RepID=A0ACB9ZHR6_9HYME|nr:uncharacterized LOC128125815 [Venturia canescens]KAI5630597.1 hypothetical protein KP791_000080 [Venturia canescens]